MSKFWWEQQARKQQVQAWRFFTSAQTMEHVENALILQDAAIDAALNAEFCWQQAKRLVQ